MPVNLALISVLACAVPQIPSVPHAAISPQMRFVDWSAELDRLAVHVVVGRLDRLREGKRERLREGGQLGNATSTVQISGTQYYRVPVRTRLVRATPLDGAAFDGATELAFELQLARLPDGTERRQVQTGTGAAVEEGLLAVWVVEKPRKGRGWSLLHVIAFDPASDRGDDPEAAFVATVSDFQDVNRRMADLRALLDATADVDDAGREAALKTLREAAEQKLELRVPADDALVTQHVEPLLRRVRERIAALEKDG